MKFRTMLLTAALTLGSLTAVPGLANPSTGSSPQDGPISPVVNPKVMPTVALQCRNYGGQQDVSKNPDIINSTRKTIPSGKTLYWKSSDGDSGVIQLDAVPARYSSRAAFTIWAKLRGSRLAPPTRAPSISGWVISSRAFSGFTLPPY